MLIALDLRWEMGDVLLVSSSSSLHISSDSVMPFLRSRVIPRRSLFLVVGVRGTAFPLTDSICSIGLAIPVSASESLSSSTKPMPGVSGFCDTAGRVVGSSLRRQERAKTPARRIKVPNAI